MALNNDQKLAIEVLAGLCVSSKDPPTVSRLLRDYTEIEGRQLDYSGFNNILDMLRASNRFDIVNHGGILYVSARLSYDSIHISAMVHKQRSNKKRGRAGGPPPRDGLFYVAMPHKRHTPAYSYRPGSIRPLRSSSQIRPQQPRNMSYIPNFSKQTTNTGGQRHIVPKTAPFVSQLAKIQKQATYQPTPVKSQSSGSKNFNIGFGRPITKNLPPLPSQLAKVQKQIPIEPPKQPLPKIVVVQQPRYELNQDSDTGLSAPTRVLQSKNLLNVPAIQQPSEFRKETNDGFTIRKLENITLNENENKKPQVLPHKVNEGRDNNLGRVNHNVTGSIYKSKSPIPKVSVQERLEQIKRSNNGDYSVSKKSEELIDATLEDTKEQIKIDIPLGWWTAGNYNDVQRLRHYCVLNRLFPPEFQFFQVRVQRKVRYQCRVTIGDFTHSTYPEDFVTKEESLQVCAAGAVATIKAQEESLSYPEFHGSRSEIAEKIYDMVSEHEMGVFLNEIPNLFRSKYSLSIQQLKVDQIILKDYSDLFTVEPCPHAATKSLVVFAVLRNQTPTKSDTIHSELNDTQSSFLPPRLTLPWNEINWNVFVTFPETTTSIWCNLLGSEYYGALNELYLQMHSSGVTEHPTDILLNEYYIAIVQGDYNRVKVVQMNNDEKKYFSHFIDTGETTWLNIEQLYVCEAKFLELPPQAISLSLKGLELFSTLDEIGFCLSDLDGKVLVATVQTTKEEFMEYENSIEVILFDTSTENDININDETLEKISKTILKPPTLKQSINSVVITRVLDSGIIVGNLKITGYTSIINAEINRLLEDKEKLDQCKGMIQDNADEVYLMYDKQTGRYSRVKILETKEANEIDVHLIDYGNYSATDKRQIFAIGFISKILTIIPPQEIRMRLHGISNTNDPYVVSLIRGLLKPNVITIVKVCEQGPEPSVTIHIRTNEKLQSINEAIETQLRLNQQQTSDDEYE